MARIVVQKIVLRALIAYTIVTMASLGVGAWHLFHEAANPTPAQNLLGTQDSLQWQLNTSHPQFVQSSLELPASGFTLDISATLPATPSSFSAWGVWLENADGARMVIAINSMAYVTARLCPSSGIIDPHLLNCEAFIEPTQGILTYWKSFNHLAIAGNSNNIRLSFLPAQWSQGLELRLNREWMWDIPWVIANNAVAWGVWLPAGVDGVEGLTVKAWRG